MTINLPEINNKSIVTVLDYSSGTVAIEYIDEKNNEEVEAKLTELGYHLSNCHYMTSQELEIVIKC